jgi:hypothetical protein
LFITAKANEGAGCNLNESAVTNFNANIKTLWKKFKNQWHTSVYVLLWDI